MSSLICAHATTDSSSSMSNGRQLHFYKLKKTSIFFSKGRLPQIFFQRRMTSNYFQKKDNILVNGEKNKILKAVRYAIK
jgi:hypothetical protein